MMEEELAKQIQELVMLQFLPSITSVDCLPLVSEIWKYVSQMDYKLR